MVLTPVGKMGALRDRAGAGPQATAVGGADLHHRHPDDVGRSLKATRDYLIGTVGSALSGAALEILVPHHGEGALLAVLVLAVAAAGVRRRDQSQPERNTDHGHYCAAVLPIINHPDVLDSAIDRVLEVTVGAFTGFLVSFLVLP